jgi:hypothetical protein
MAGDNNCVEVAFHGDSVLVRDSKNPIEELRFSRSAWRGFLEGIRRGEFLPGD